MVTFDATDLDNATSESGVVHESVANTDHNNASNLKQGYSIANPYLNADLVGYWPLQEDSGTTAYDFSGNANHGTANGGVTVNQTGLLETSAFSFDGVDDYVDISSLDFANLTTGVTLNMWVETSNVGSNEVIFSHANRRFSLGYDFLLSNGWEANIYDTGGNDHTATAGTGNYTSGWNMFTATFDGSTLTLYVNGSSVDSTSANEIDLDTNNQTIGMKSSGANYANANVCQTTMHTRALTASEIQTLYDVVDTSGTLTTPYKTV